MDKLNRTYAPPDAIPLILILVQSKNIDMISFFRTPSQSVIAVETEQSFTEETVKKLAWLFGEAALLSAERVDRYYVGPRREMITPWSTCAVEITQNMGIEGITRKIGRAHV